jgi:dUTP pyrophosphatase
MTDATTPQAVLPGVLSREQLLARIAGPDHPLIAGLLDAEDQVQPNGVDLTLQSIARHRGAGTIGVSNTDRVLPALEDVPFDANGWVTLEPGIYHIVYNEIVDIPTNLMALGRPRSSLARSGVAIHTAVWDAGYRGRSTSLLSVLNPDGFRVQQNARVMQLVFFGMAQQPESGYSGTYQHENTRN